MSDEKKKSASKSKKFVHTKPGEATVTPKPPKAPKPPKK